MKTGLDIEFMFTQRNNVLEIRRDFYLTMDININHTVMERIHGPCPKRRITKGELVRLSGVNQVTVYEIRGGRFKNLSINTLFKIADTFNISLSKLFDDPAFSNERNAL